MIEPQLAIKFNVIAYDESGYGDNRSQDFTNGDKAVAYAKGLEERFHAHVFKRITMQPISQQIYP